MKRGWRVRIEARLAVWGQFIAGGIDADAGLQIARGQGASVLIVKVSIWWGTPLKSVRSLLPASVAVATHPASLDEEIANGESSPVGAPVPETRFAVGIRGGRRHDLGEGCQRQRTPERTRQRTRQACNCDECRNRASA
jgi:hypothetical protein